MRTADSITNMFSTSSFLFTYALTFKLLMSLLSALYFSCFWATNTSLVNNNFASCTKTLMATSRTDMPTLQFATARHSTNRYIVLAAFSILGIPSQQLDFVFTTRTSLLKFGSFLARATLSKVTFVFTFMKATVQFFLTNLSTWVCSSTTINYISSFTAIATGHFFFLARLTRACMTIFFTLMLITVKNFFTLFTTLKSNSFLTTFCHSLAFSTLAHN